MEVKEHAEMVVNIIKGLGFESELIEKGSNFGIRVSLNRPLQKAEVDLALEMEMLDFLDTVQSGNSVVVY